MQPKKVLWTAALTLFVFSSCKKDLAEKNSEDNIIETIPALQTAINASVSDDCSGYYQAIPSRYDSSSKKYPLILFIHGIGELGNGTSDLPNMLRTGLPRLIYKKNFPADFQFEGKHFSFIVISPQFKHRPNSAETNSVLQYMLKRYRVDTSRIYVTGLSMGGGVAWEFASDYGASIAAATPICGGAWPDEARASRIASFNLPVWATHDVDDATVPVSYSRDWVSKINNHHPAISARITTWPTGGHDAWTKTYDPAFRENGMNIYEWMLQYTHVGLSK
jgi:predicted peptidase